jgi:DNA-binding CsgD family transcriptional regulator
MLAWKARVNLETGNWEQAFSIANKLLTKENLLPVIKTGALVVAATIKMRRGDENVLPLLLEAKTIALKTAELQRIVPVLVALLEYEWITGKTCIEQEVLDRTLHEFLQAEKMSKKSRFCFWLQKVRKQQVLPKEKLNGSGRAITLEGAPSWEQLSCPYEQALCLFEGDENDKRVALSMMQQLGAEAVSEKLEMHMRSWGIKRIPRGMRESTRINPAQLTNRELDVLHLLKNGIHNKEIAETLFISPKTVDHHISSILFKLDVNSRSKAVAEANRLGILK